MSTWVLAARDGNQRFNVDLETSPVTIGRSDQNDVVIDDTQVSRQHAQIEARDGGAWVADLGSKNGTWLNGQRVGTTASEIRDGDEVRFGELAFQVQGADDRTRSIAVRRSEETVTVLFTDLEGHTALFEELGTKDSNHPELGDRCSSSRATDG